MRKALPQMLEIAALLISHEASAAPRSSPPTAHVCEKLRPMLSMLMGATGFRALLTRALTLASADCVALHALTVNAGGSLVLAQGSASTVALDDREAGTKLVAYLLSLLVAFIGDTLTLQLLADVWPRLLPHAPNFRTGDHK